MKTYFIWGMGLLGTSLAMALREKSYSIMGCVRSQRDMDDLVDMGFTNIYLETDKCLEGCFKQVDGIIIATPVKSLFSILRYLSNIDLKRHTWITDVSSTKKQIITFLQEFDQVLPFVGSHPMAGSDLNGAKNARGDLFHNALIFITRSVAMEDKLGTMHYDTLLTNVKKMWEGLNAVPYEISHQEHDKWAAYLSHGLHLVSCMVSILLKDIPTVFAIPHCPTGGSFKDITRVAGSNPALWEGIIQSNTDEVVRYLHRVVEISHGWATQLENGTLSLQDIFTEAKELRNKITFLEECDNATL